MLRNTLVWVTLCTYMHSSQINFPYSTINQMHICKLIKAIPVHITFVKSTHRKKSYCTHQTAMCVNGIFRHKVPQHQHAFGCTYAFLCEITEFCPDSFRRALYFACPFTESFLPFIKKREKRCLFTIFVYILNMSYIF